jgi:uncharacterized protein YggT (Ycf19 family)
MVHTHIHEKLVTTDDDVVAEVPVEHPVKVYQQKKAIFRAYQVIWYVLGVVEILLAFRILLKMIGANPRSPFVDFIYFLSAPFAVPFQGVLATTASTGSVLEWSTFVAMLVYLIVAMGIVELMKFVKPTTLEEVENNVDAV